MLVDFRRHATTDAVIATHDQNSAGLIAVVNL